MAVSSPASRRPQHLTFRLGQEEYALPAVCVRQVRSCADLVPLDSAPSWIRGVLWVRDCPVPAVDLAVRLGGSTTALTSSTCTLLIDVALGYGPETIGLVVDGVGQTVDLVDDDIDPPPSFGSGVDVGFLYGVGRLGTRLLLVLDVNRLFSVEDGQLLSELLASAAADAAMPDEAAAPSPSGGPP